MSAQTLLQEGAINFSCIEIIKKQKTYRHCVTQIIWSGESSNDIGTTVDGPTQMILIQC